MWTKLKTWFHDSETIFLARLTALAGIVLQVVSVTDPHLLEPMIGGKWFPAFLIAWGILTEYARKRRDPDMLTDGK